jgi:hypothetical protein
MARVLRERRDKVGRIWFARVNPADRFRIVEAGERNGERQEIAGDGTGGTFAAGGAGNPGGGGGGGAGGEILEFDDLAVAGHLADPGTTRYRYRIDRRGGGDGAWHETAAAAVGLGTPPGAARESVAVTVELGTRRGESGWSSATRVLLVRGETTRIVGIER